MGCMRTVTGNSHRAVVQNSFCAKSRYKTHQLPDMRLRSGKEDSMVTTTKAPASTALQALLGDQAETLLGFSPPKISKERLHVPGPDFVDRIFLQSDRNNRVLGNLEWIHNSGRLAGTGYLSILPVDQGIEHSAGASFAKNPDYFDPENIVKLA